MGWGVVTGVVKDAVGWEVRREGSGDGGANSVTGGLIFAVRSVRVNDGRLDWSGWEERVVQAVSHGLVGVDGRRMDERTFDFFGCHDTLLG